MRSPIPFNPTRAERSLTAGALTPQEAAARLARLEFSVARLKREIATSERRALSARRDLARHLADRETLLGIISRDTAAMKRKDA